MNSYKRRINRIYPSMIANAFVGCLFFNTIWSVIEIVTASSFWFISCIMVYYIFIYIIGKYMPSKIMHAMILVCIITAVWFSFIYNQHSSNLFGGHPIRWLHSFNFMLLGAYISMNLNSFKPGNNIYDAMLMVVYTALFYGLFLFSEILGGHWRLLQYFSIFPLLGAMIYFYKVASSSWITRFYKKKYVHFVIRFVGGLCLEIYLVQGFLITGKYNSYFPLNIFIVFIIIVVVAYLTRCLARFISQTFNEAPYDLKRIVSLF